MLCGGSITDYILVPTLQMFPIRVWWALLLGSWRKIAFLTFAYHPIHNKDNRKGFKNKGKLRERHLRQGHEAISLSREDDK